MPKLLAPDEVLMMNIVEATAEQYIPSLEPGQLISALHSVAILRKTYHGLSEQASNFKTEEDHIIRGAWILGRDATYQTGDILNAERKVIKGVRDPDEIESILLASSGVGRAFSRVSSKPEMITSAGRVTNDTIVLNELTSRRKRSQFLDHHSDQGRVVVTQAGKEFLAPHMNIKAGCPAIASKIDPSEAGKVKLFDTFWDDAVHRYVQRFVRPRLHVPYSRKRFHAY
jgi:hypothetical protein